jgi:hypothetical protein
VSLLKRTSVLAPPHQSAIRIEVIDRGTILVRHPDRDDHEKDLLDNGKLAVINDFGVAQIAIDNATGRFTRLPGYQPDVPGLDASDRDSSINIRNWPLRGRYLPDAIAAYRAHGRTWLVTANEGNARDRTDLWKKRA